MNTFGLTIREFTFDQKSFWRDPQTVFFIVGQAWPRPPGHRQQRQSH
jgi:hypothetical protein